MARDIKPKYVDQFLETFSKLVKERGVDAAAEFVTAFCTENDIPKFWAAIAVAASKAATGDVIEALISLLCRLLDIGMQRREYPLYGDAVQAAIRTYREKVGEAPAYETGRRSRYLQLDFATHDLRDSFEKANRLGNTQDAVRIALLIGLVAMAKEYWEEAALWLEPLRSATRKSIPIFEKRAAEQKEKEIAFLKEVRPALRRTAELLCDDNGARQLAPDSKKLLAYLKHYVPSAKPKELETIAYAVISEFNVRFWKAKIEKAEVFLLATKQPPAKPLLIDRIPLTLADELSDDFSAGIQA
ncbi:MAG: hypothetical protein WCC87_07280 [Candidatus Korobacteraceae bacterium]